MCPALSVLGSRVGLEPFTQHLPNFLAAEKMTLDTPYNMPNPAFV